MSRSWVAIIAISVLGACGSGDDASSNDGSQPAQPSSAETTPPPQPSDIVASTAASLPSSSWTEPDVTAVAVAAAVARVTNDNSFGGAAVFDHVNIVERFGAATHDGFIDVDASSPPIDATTRVAMEHALAPAAVTWVSSLAAVIGTGQQLPTYENVGAVLTLGHPAGDGDQATITTGLWCGGTCGVGGAHTLERQSDGSWQVTGTTGPQWMA